MVCRSDNCLFASHRERGFIPPPDYLIRCPGLDRRQVGPRCIVCSPNTLTSVADCVRLTFGVSWRRFSSSLSGSGVPPLFAGCQPSHALSESATSWKYWRRGRIGFAPSLRFRSGVRNWVLPASHFPSSVNAVFLRYPASPHVAVGFCVPTVSA